MSLPIAFPLDPLKTSTIGPAQSQQEGAERKPMPPQCERLDYGMSFVRRPTCFTAQVFNIRRFHGDKSVTLPYR
jgi:hypothetical protein